MTDTVHAAGPLDEPDDGPRQVVIDDDMAVLEVLAFTQHVGRNDNAEFIVQRHLVAFAVADGAEAPGAESRVAGVAGYALDAFHTHRGELAFQVARRIGELGEDDDLVIGMVFHEGGGQRLELLISRRFPLSGVLQNLQQALGVAFKVVAQFRDEQVGAQPLEAAVGLFVVECVDLLSLAAELFQGMERLLEVFWAVLVSIFLEVETRVDVIGILIVYAGVEHLHVLCADGDGKTVLDGVYVDVVAENMALDGLEEHRAAALQALEETGPAEAHKTLAGAGEVFDLFRLNVRRGLGRGRRDVIPQSVAREIELVDGLDDILAVEATVLVVFIAFIDAELEGLGDARREVGAASVLEGQELLFPFGIILGIVVLDETACAPYKEKAHEFTPVVGVFTALKGGERANGTLVPPEEFGLPDILEQPLRADSEVTILGDEEAELVGQIKVALVVGGGRQQDDAAFVLLNVVADGLIALAFAVAEVVALVHDHEAVAAAYGQFSDCPGDGEHLGT